MTFQELETLRLAAGLSVKRLCSLAGCHDAIYYRLKHGRQRIRTTTALRFQRACKGVRSFPRRRAETPDLLAASYRAYVAVLARETGCDPATILASDPSIRATASPEWAQAAWLRALAVYCVVVEFGVASSRVAAAIGVTKQAASQMCRRVTDRRDDGNELDLLLERVGKMISGRE